MHSRYRIALCFTFSGICGAVWGELCEQPGVGNTELFVPGFCPPEPTFQTQEQSGLGDTRTFRAAVSRHV